MAGRQAFLHGTTTASAAVPSNAFESCASASQASASASGAEDRVTVPRLRHHLSPVLLPTSCTCVLIYCQSKVFFCFFFCIAIVRLNRHTYT